MDSHDLAPVAVDATAVLSVRERLAPVVVIETDDKTNGWKRQSNTIASGQN